MIKTPEPIKGPCKVYWVAEAKEDYEDIVLYLDFRYSKVELARIGIEERELIDPCYNLYITNEKAAARFEEEKDAMSAAKVMQSILGYNNESTERIFTFDPKLLVNVFNGMCNLERK